MTRIALYERAWVDVVRPQHVPGMLIELSSCWRHCVSSSPVVVGTSTWRPLLGPGVPRPWSSRIECTTQAAVPTGPASTRLIRFWRACRSYPVSSPTACFFCSRAVVQRGGFMPRLFSSMWLRAGLVAAGPHPVRQIASVHGRTVRSDVVRKNV